MAARFARSRYREPFSEWFRQIEAEASPDLNY